ncbi:MAG: M20/M25/M40 family metallo-hydrolase [Candidatus Diapherotrites archaeon]
MKPDGSLGYELALLRRLVSFRTFSPEEKGYSACAEFVAREGKRIGAKVKRFSPKAKGGVPMPNLIISLNRGAKETLLLITHYDTVPAGEGWGKRDPFRLLLKRGIVYGRGAGDDKGAIAAALGAMRELAHGKKLRRNVKLAVACDEENGGAYGMGYLAKHCRHALKADAALVIDSDAKIVEHGCSGTVSAELTLTGAEGHAACPHLNRNALEEALPFLVSLVREYKKLREKKRSKANACRGKFPKVWGRFSLTVLNAGQKTNMFPDRVSAKFDIRALPEESAGEVMREFRSFVKRMVRKHKLARFRPRLSLKGSTGYLTPENAEFIRELRANLRGITGKKFRACAVLGADDGRFVARLGIPVAGFGPGGKNEHSPRESISLRNIALTKELIKRCCL